MLNRFWGLIIFCGTCFSAFAQRQTIEFKSSDTALQTAFYRAKEMAMFYRGNPTDPVGPWYEAALPSRNAFCVRDVSHQCIAAEILGMKEENINILTKFVSNISEAKDWCTYWEMNKLGKPAPEDYRNDKEFWYNLNANFELIYTCWRMYLWTGDRTYISNREFKRFSDISVKEYMDRWMLQVDSLLKRPAHLNTPVPYNPQDYFHSCRGLPSYNEALGNMRMGADLVAAIYRGLKTYADIATLLGQLKTASEYQQKAEAYRKHLEAVWWDEDARLYNTYLTDAGIFGKAEGETYLLWYNALTDSSRIRSSISHLISAKWNVENLSYLPYQLYRYGYADSAYRYVLYLTDPATKRREYPEVSFGVIEGVVQGMMGVEPDARENRLTTIYNNHSVHFSELSNLPVLSSRIQLRHWDKGTTLTNHGKKAINWRVAFYGNIPFITVAGKKVKAVQEADIMGRSISYVEVQVLPEKKITATIR